MWTLQNNNWYAAIGSLKVTQLTLDSAIVHKGTYEVKKSEIPSTALADTLLIGNTDNIHCRFFLSLVIVTKRRTSTSMTDMFSVIASKK